MRLAPLRTASEEVRLCDDIASLFVSSVGRPSSLPGVLHVVMDGAAGGVVA